MYAMLLERGEVLRARLVQNADAEARQSEFYMQTPMHCLTAISIKDFFQKGPHDP